MLFLQRSTFGVANVAAVEFEFEKARGRNAQVFRVWHSSTLSAAMKISELATLVSSYDKAKAFLRSRNVISSEVPNCSICNRIMTEISYRGGTVFRCPSHKGQKASLFRNSILADSHITMEDFTLDIWILSCGSSSTGKLLICASIAFCSTSAKDIPFEVKFFVKNW